MRKALQPSQRVHIPIFGGKYYPALQPLHQSALAGNTEFFSKIRADSGYLLHFNSLHLKSSV